MSIANPTSNQRVELKFLLVLLLQDTQYVVITMQKPLHFLLKNGPLDAIEHGLAFIENEASKCSKEEDHSEHPIRIVTCIHEVYLLLAVLLDLLLGKLRDVDRDLLVEEPNCRSVGELVLVDQLVFLLEGLFGLWEDDHFCSVGQGYN